nr:mandelate racemase/muconate lactonizing enzyme family protein [Enterocloster bolteae]
MPYTPQEAAEEALRWKEQGFSAVKMGWGGFELPQFECVKLVEATRNAIGDDMDMMLDIGFIPSGDFNVTAASRLLLINEIREFKPYWIEEAVYPDDYEGYKMLVESTDVRIAGGENETTRYGFKQLIEVCKLDILQPDITRCGGLTEAKRIGAMATAHNTTVIPHAWSSGIVIAASLHFIATQSNSNLLEYCVWDTPIRKEMLKQDFKLRDGYVDVPMGPGLGIEIDDEAIQKYRCDII